MDNLPSLVEPGVRSFLGGALKECRKFKDSHTSLIFNVSMVILVVVVVGGFLTYRYKGKPTPEAISLRNRQTQEYLVSKLQQLSAIRHVKNENMITNLPTWHDHPEAKILGRKL